MPDQMARRRGKIEVQLNALIYEFIYFAIFLLFFFLLPSYQGKSSRCFSGSGSESAPLSNPNQ